MPYIGKSNDGFGIRERFIYLATSGDTTVSGTDSRGISLTFSDPEYVDVYLNGVRLKLNTDYNLNTANTVSGLAALSDNDEVEVIVYDIFSLADVVSANAGGIFNNNITVDGDLTVNDDLSLLSDASVLNFGADSEIKLTHVADTGLLLTDSGGTPTLQLTDANESIASDGSKVIITSGGTAFSLPTADGSNGQALATNGSGVLSFIDVSSAADDLTAGDAAINLTTTSGNITIDAQAGDSDIIFKGTDGSTDTTFLTIDGSDGGKLLPNNGIDLNGKELILDADADTSITADTDDKIDFRIAGADVMQMNATAFSGGAIYENADDIAANYSITAGKNAMSVGPMNIASGVTVTVPSGQRWVIL